MTSRTLYIPTTSPRPVPTDPLWPLTPTSRRSFLASILSACTPDELQYISETISPLLKRDVISSLPPEVALCILSFLESPLTLIRVGAVSRRWRALAGSAELWRGMCGKWGFDVRGIEVRGNRKEDDEPLEEMEPFAELPMDPALEWLMQRKRKARRSAQSIEYEPNHFSYRAHFKNSYIKLLHWRNGGRLLRTHRLSMLSSPPLHAHTSRIPSNPSTTTQPQHQPDSGVVTCIALDSSWIVVGLANSRVHIFSAKTGVLARTLVGHESGVWGLCLVSAFGRPMDGERRRMKEKRSKKEKEKEVREDEEEWRSLPAALKAAVGLGSEVKDGGDNLEEGEEEEFSKGESGDEDEDTNSSKERYVPERQSNSCFASKGWGQPNALVVSGGCDKVVRVWDVKSGHCIHALHGHTSTIRCMRTLHHRPLAVTGSRDGTLRTWDIQRGRPMRVLEGHQSSVRCLDVNGVRAVSGSYDTTCRVWDLDTGECLHVLVGHYHQVYSVAFDGILVATGGLDTTIRIWDVETGVCQALLQGHTALVCQLQLSRKHQLLVTGGSDGRVITFSLAVGEGGSRSVLMPPLREEEKETTNGANIQQQFARGRPNGIFSPSPSLSRTTSTSTSTTPLRLPPTPTPTPTHTPTHSHIQSYMHTHTRKPYEPLYRLSAHTSSITSLQFDGRFLVTGGNDGCVHVWETQTGAYVRRLGEEGEGVWKVGFVGWAVGEGEEREEGEEVGEEAGDVCVIAGRREGKIVLDVWTFGELGGLESWRS